MGEREREVLGDELLDVGALDVLGLLELDDTEDLSLVLVTSDLSRQAGGGVRTWIDLNRARWRAAISAYSASTAAALEVSRYSLYMLWVPDRES